MAQLPGPKRGLESSYFDALERRKIGYPEIVLARCGVTVSRLAKAKDFNCHQCGKRVSIQRREIVAAERSACADGFRKGFVGIERPGWSFPWKAELEGGVTACGFSGGGAG